MFECIFVASFTSKTKTSGGGGHHLYFLEGKRRNNSDFSWGRGETSFVSDKFLKSLERTEKNESRSVLKNIIPRA